MSGYHASDGPRYAAPMSTFFDLVAQGRYSHLSGTTTETVAVPAGAVVISWSGSCPTGGAAATLVITPGGAAQVAAALPTITIPPGRGLDDPFVMGRLGPGTTFAFTGTDAFFVTLLLPAGASS